MSQPNLLGLGKSISITMAKYVSLDKTRSLVKIPRNVFPTSGAQKTCETNGFFYLLIWFDVHLR